MTSPRQQPPYILIIGVRAQEFPPLFLFPFRSPAGLGRIRIELYKGIAQTMPAQIQVRYKI